MAFRKILWQQKQQRERRAESSFEFSVLVFGSSRLSDKRIKGSRVSLRFAWRYTKCDKSIFFAVVFLCSQFILMMFVCVGPRINLEGCMSLVSVFFRILCAVRFS